MKLSPISSYVQFDSIDGIVKENSYYLINFHESRLKNQGVSIEVYFDAYDVIKTINGLQPLVQSSSLNRSEIKTFFEERSLIYALFFGGWLPPVKMLTPHQFEFIAYVNHDRFENTGFLTLKARGIEAMSSKK